MNAKHGDIDCKETQSLSNETDAQLQRDSNFKDICSVMAFSNTGAIPNNYTHPNKIWKIFLACDGLQKRV